MRVFMTLNCQKFFALVLAACVLAAGVAEAQGPPPPDAMPYPSQPATPLSQDQLDALLAPIALYPDQVLSQLLIASTYPLQAVEAARCAHQHPGRRPDA